MSFAAFLSRRAGRALLVIVGISIATFLLSRAFADPAQIMLPVTASPADLDHLRDQLGLNQSLPAQFWDFATGAVHGDLGISFWQNVPALGLAASRLPASLILATGSIVLACLLAIPLGLMAGRKPGSPLDRVITVISGTGVAVPDFWFAILLIIVFSVQFGLLPSSGYGSVSHAILPIVALTLRPMGRLTQITREATRAEFTKQYVQVARAKGLNETAIVRRHIVKNILPLVITMMSFDFLFVFTGWAASVETVFGWPGLGKLAVDATTNQDLTLMSAIVVLTGALIAIVNMLVDATNAAIDRRMRD